MSEQELERLRGKVAALRPEVVAFAILMERRLKENDYKGGWKQTDPTIFLRRMYEELTELEEAVAQQLGNVGLEAADVANFAMMVCDELGFLPP